MNPLVLTLHRTLAPGQRIHFGGVTPDQLQCLSVPDIANRFIAIDGQSSRIGDWFEIEDGDHSVLQLRGDLSRLDFVGQAMHSGTIEVASCLGHHLADGMTGGQIIVHGNVGQHAGSLMRGGLVRVMGNAGDFLGGAPPGKKRGISGGQLVVDGNAGRWAAARMRRGMLVVRGNIASGLALRMIAGTVVCCGNVEAPFGCGMRRGTLLLLSHLETNTSRDLQSVPGFTAEEQSELSYLPLLLRQIREVLPNHLNQRLPDKFSEYPRVGYRSIGDRCAGGLGEIVWLPLI